MAIKGAPFYSCRAGRPETIKGHRTKGAAINAAGEFGQIWDSARAEQRQVHLLANGTWGTFNPERFTAVDLKEELLKEGLIDLEPDSVEGSSSGLDSN
jgi:hypothetical protein